MSFDPVIREPVVITGIGLMASLGLDRETVWAGVQNGESRFHVLSGVRGIEETDVIGATVDLDEELHGRIKVLPMCERAAAEAIDDANLELESVDNHRFGCMISGTVGDLRWVDQQLGLASGDTEEANWFEQLWPDSICSSVARKFEAYGPRLCHSTACASSLISVLTAARAIRDGQCDIALAGGGDAIDPIFVAGFDRMRVLAKDDDPSRACRPFDRSRKGFVFGEGAAVFVVERLGHALRRGARIYATISATKSLAQAHHITSIDADNDALVHLIQLALEEANLAPADVGYINAHGTGTEQNDAAEAAGICRVFGPDLDKVCVSATKSSLGHMINGAGAVELAITALAMRDGFAPPTLNLTDPDPACKFDCLPLLGRVNQFQHGLKISQAFGGHLVAILLSRWNDAATGFAYPDRRKAA
jgi:3-oxoacyl-(acyl-carrier-protein) synthase